MIKAIMLDVDGTLVSFETHKVLPSSVDALRKIHDGGIRIVIATGRADRKSTRLNSSHSH